MSGNWDITEHSRSLLIIHEYTLDTEGTTWTASFTSETRGTYSKADKTQDEVILTRNTPEGGEISLYLARI